MDVKKPYRFMINILKTALSTLVVLVVILFSTFGTVAATEFENHWAKNQLQDWIEKGLLKGYLDGSVKPDHNISRAEFMALVNRVFGYTEKTTINYSDVSPKSWYFETIAIASEVGYIEGFNDGTIRPEKEINRQEVATILARIQNLTSDNNSAAQFKDTIPNWSEGSISAVVDSGYMVGYPDGTFGPTKLIKRGEAIVALDRVIKDSVVVYGSPGTFGQDEGTEIIYKNVEINASDVILQNIVIEGNFTISESVGEGDVVLNNVIVKGVTTINGGGENSIHLNNSILGETKIDKVNDNVRVVATGNTDIGEILLSSGSKLEEYNLTGKGFSNIVISASSNTKVVLNGHFDNVTSTSEGAMIEVSANSIIVLLTLEASATLTGQGTINTANVEASGVTFEKTPSNVSVKDGEEPPVTIPNSGGGSGGGGTAPTKIEVNSIEFSPTTMELIAGGETGSVDITISPSNASDKSITWSSSNTAIATVTNGIVTPLSPGTTIIKAQSVSDNTKTATIDVTVVAPNHEEYYEYEVVEGKAIIKSYSFEGPKDVYIPDTLGGYPVTEIADGISGNNPIGVFPRGITSVVFPESLVKIGDSAFYDNALTKIIIPDGVTYIGADAFRKGSWSDNDPLIRELILGDNLEYIGNSAFVGHDLSSLILPNSLKKIGQAAFMNAGLNQVDLGIGIEIIGPQAFSGNNITNIILPETVTQIGRYAFAGNLLSEIEIPDSVTEIGNGAFAGVDYTKITLGTGFTSYWRVDHDILIGHIAPPKILHVPSEVNGVSITTIGRNAFNGNLIDQISFPEGLEYIGFQAFAHNNLTDVDFPSTLLSIGEGAFAFNPINELTIPDSVIHIGNNAFRYMNYKDITLGSGFTEYWVMSGNTLLGHIATPKEIIIPETVNGVTVERINDFAFHGFNDHITSVEFPNTLQEIGRYAFNGTYSLTPIHIHASIKSIGEMAFGRIEISEITFDTNTVVLADNLLEMGDNQLRDAYLEGGIGTYRITEERSWVKVVD